MHLNHSLADRTSACSVIGSWRDAVLCLSVCPSICSSVTLCIMELWRSWSVQRIKSFTVVFLSDSEKALPIHFFRHFAVDVSFSHNTRRKTEPPKFPRL